MTLSKAAVRRKGHDEERALCALLRERGWEATRCWQAVRGHQMPDVEAVYRGQGGQRRLLVECKNDKKLPGKGVLDALDQAQAVDDLGLKVAVCKVAGTSRRVAVLELEDLLELIEWGCV